MKRKTGNSKKRLIRPVEIDESDLQEEDEDGNGKSKGGMPIADSISVEYDGSRPLTNPKYEAFARKLAQGIAQVVAYKETISRDCSPMTAHTESKRLAKRPEVASRVAHMIRITENCEAPTEKREAIVLCNRIIRKSGVPDMVKLQAIDRLAKMFRWYDPPKESEDTGVPDPAFFAQYVENMRNSVKKGSSAN